MFSKQTNLKQIIRTTRKISAFKLALVYNQMFLACSHLFQVCSVSPIVKRSNSIL